MVWPLRLGETPRRDGNTHHMQLPPSPRPFQSRRRFPRIEVLGLVEGRQVPLDAPLTIRELSLGGFSTESTVPFPPGSHHRFRFLSAAHAEVVLDATVVHCRLAKATADGQLAYISGFEFHSDPMTDRAIASLVDTLSSVLSLD
jgi:hypothetical protein